VIHSNHMDMCKFSTNDHPDYILVAGVLRRWVNDAQKGKQRAVVFQGVTEGSIDVTGTSE
jgi:hypothetical protein